MPSGTLQVYAAVAGQSAPLAGVTVTVYDENGARLARVQTDGQGMAPELTLDAPDRALSLDESNTTVRPYAVYQLTAALAGWQEQSLAGVQVFDGQQTVARLDLLPADTALAAARQGPVVIPEHVLFAGGGGSGRPPADRQADPRVLTEVVIPRRITVHLGAPSSTARNVTVPFQEYIANVASSEVYPGRSRRCGPTSWRRSAWHSTAFIPSGTPAGGTASTSPGRPATTRPMWRAAPSTR